MSSLRVLPMLLVTCSCSVYSAGLLSEDASSGGTNSASGGKGSEVTPGAGRSTGGGGAANGHAGEGGDTTGGTTVTAMGGMSGATAGAAGTNGTTLGGSPPTAGMGGMGGMPVELGASELIDDMEDGNFTIIPKPPRYGSWYVAGDTTVGAKIPKLEDLMGTVDPARDGSTSAVHFTASGFKGWGASVGLMFTDSMQKRTPYDFGDAAAISFWLRGSVTDNVKLKVQLPTSGTDPSGTVCGGTNQGQCLDHFSTMIAVTSDWKLITIRLDSLHQAGWGVPLDKFESNKVLGIEWSAGTANVDLWIDDLSLVHPK